MRALQVFVAFCRRNTLDEAKNVIASCCLRFPCMHKILCRLHRFVDSKDIANAGQSLQDSISPYWAY